MTEELRLSYVTAPGCRFCEEGRTMAGRLSSETGLAIQELDWDSPSARALAGGEPPLFPPALYLGGRLLGYGRLSERRLRKLLREVHA